MRNFDFSILAAITDNLRNRYEDGFPVLKELIQNADDAGARRLLFGWHPGFGADAVDHPLLTGPALWFLNDGTIKPGDLEGLCAFGINSKAADAATIGKFGLGMKSVFHLCEAFFFVAWDGQAQHHECLSPWNPTIHPDWEQETARDWAALAAEAQAHIGAAGADDGAHWFLLWLPLRQKRHLRKLDGDFTDPITQRFPGDRPDQELAFLRESDLALHLAEIMPLLHHLTRIEAVSAGADLIPTFAATRGSGSAGGQVLLSNGLPALAFDGRQQDRSDERWFAAIKGRDDWPRSSWRNPQTGREEQKPDKSRAEAAVLLARASDADRLSLRWAVFLPLSEREEVRHNIGAGAHFRLTLHGQFFVDSGRKDVFAWDALFEPIPDLPVDARDEAILRRAWNARLFQHVLASLVLPVLAELVASERLSERECRALTQAIKDTELYRRGQAFLCADADWCRCLTPTGADWRMVERDERLRLRPLPPPPGSAPGRPWQVFPGLQNLALLTFDGDAPILSVQAYQWPEADLQQLFSQVTGILTDGPAMDWLTAFLDHPLCARPWLRTDWLQRALIGLLRGAMGDRGSAALGQYAEKARRLIGLIEPARRHLLAAELPESVQRRLLKVNQPFLLVPIGFEGRNLAGEALPGALKADAAALLAWLRVIDETLAGLQDGAVMQPLLKVATGLLGTLDQPGRTALLRAHPDLRIVPVWDARTRQDRAVSPQQVAGLGQAGALFGFASGPGGAQYGLAPLLAVALPKAEVWLIRASDRDLLPDSPIPPAADQARAILAAVARYPGAIGDESARKALLKQANDPGSNADARRGLRLLLHGARAHREDDGPLWIAGQHQHQAWARLWGKLYPDDDWRLVPRSLADCIPLARWQQAQVQEIAPPPLIEQLQRTGQGILAPADFTVEQRDEILANIEDQTLWRRLPLHTRCTDDGPVSLSGAQKAYMAPATGCPDDALTRTALIIRRSENLRQVQRQVQWLLPLDDQALIEIALADEQPMQHWGIIMDALGRLAPAGDDPLWLSLRERAWLPTRPGEPVRPADVLDLPAGLRDMTARLVADHRAGHGPCYAVPKELADDLRAHPAWPALQAHAFATGEAALDPLAMLLEELPTQHIGVWQQAPASAVLNLLADDGCLPGFGLLREAGAVFDPTTAWIRLKVGLVRDLPAARLLGLLDRLTTAVTEWPERKAAVDEYLRQLKNTPERPPDWIGRLRLASEQKQWCPPDALCAGATGIDPSRLLEAAQAKLLGGVIVQAGQPVDGGNVPGPVMTDFATLLHATPDTLRRYFAPWHGLVERPIIGALLGLLGEQMRKLAEDYLQPHGFAWYQNQLPWADPAGKTVGQALDQAVAACYVVDGGSIEVTNLLGDAMSVPLTPPTAITNLIAGTPRWQALALDSVGMRLPLRQIDPATMAPERLSGLLRATAETLYGQFYKQPGATLGALWQELERSDQLEIGIARRMILDHVPFYLRQLALRSDTLEPLLAACDRARRRVAEQDSAEASAALSQALAALGEAIAGTPELQDDVLAAVRGKVQGDFKYQPASILFELFQNADDAALELRDIAAWQGGDAAVPEVARRLAIEIGPARLRVMHWGRVVNDRGPPGFPGERRFDRDLEKMLMLGGSDKPRADGLTGKLGLGFKSLLLACKRPRLLSGKLAVEIVGGILPAPWTGADCNSARQVLAGATDGAGQAGTLIELHGLAAEIRDDVLGRFRTLAGVLCVFGKAIRRVELRRCPDASDGMADLCARWQPTTIAPGVEVGQLTVADPEWGGATTSLCLRADKGSLLVALGPRGFRRLPDVVPAIWVTAPTRETTTVGFAINGAFGLDTGRARLADDNDANEGLAKAIGTGVGSLLAQLLTMDWPTLRETVGLEPTLGADEFWHGLWIGLTEGWLHRPRDVAGKLARAAVLALLRQLASSGAAIPNGLPAPLGQMIHRDQVGYEFARPLAAEQVVAVLGGWPRLTSQFPPARLVAPAIGDILKHADLAKPAPVGPLALLKLPTAGQVEPADAGVLGQVIGLTAEQFPWHKEDLRYALRGLRFRTTADTWAEARGLLTDAGRPGRDGDGDEERLRFAIAPPGRRLHGDYGNEDGLAFLLNCRGQYEAGADELAGWVLAATSDEAKHAALRLLVRSTLKAEVADKVRDQGWLAGVANDDGLMRAAGLDDAERRELRRLLANDQVINSGYAVTGISPPPPPPPPPIPLPRALERIAAWWQQEGAARAQDYRAQLYPWDIIDLTPDTQTGDYDRSSWMTLFALAALQGMGRTRSVQHRGFLVLCDQCGWWRTFSEVDPKTNPAAWMQIIEDYVEAQHSDEEWSQWIGFFPKFYKLRRWLDVYIDLFLSIEKWDGPINLDLLLTPKQNPHFQGDGPDAPPINRTLNHGKHLVIRELLNRKLLTNAHAFPHAYAPVTRIKEFFAGFHVSIDSSRDIHRLLKAHLGEQAATFGGDYDIPLRLVAGNDALRPEVLGQDW